MRRLFSVFSKSESGSGSMLTPVTLRRATCLAAVAGVLALVPAFAQERVQKEAKSPNVINQTGPQAPTAAVMIPECLEKLKLTPPQQGQIQEIIRKYDASLDIVWKQFGDRYLTTVRTEVALLAAIEDNLTEAQRMKVRAERRTVAHAEQALEGTNQKPNQAKAKPVDAISEGIEAVGVALNADQEAAADKIHEKYLSQLRSLNRDIQGLHTRLVSLEADKLVEIEKMLTKEQLAQLRDSRLTVTPAARVTSTIKSSKTE